MGKLAGKLVLNLFLTYQFISNIIFIASINESPYVLLVKKRGANNGQKLFFRL